MVSDDPWKDERSDWPPDSDSDRPVTLTFTAAEWGVIGECLTLIDRAEMCETIQRRVSHVLRFGDA